MNKITNIKLGFASNDIISLRQLQALLFLEIFGFAIIALPRIMAGYASQDGWLSVLASGFLVLPMVVIICYIIRKFAGFSFFALCSHILGKPLGFVLSVIFSARLVLLSASNLYIFGDIIRQTMLPKTPTSIVFAVMIFISAYAASKGFETRARMAEILIFVVLLPLFFVFVVVFKDTELSNLAPAFSATPQGIGQGAVQSFFAFAGIEVMLLVAPYIKNTKRIMRYSVQLVVVMIIFMTIVTVIAIARFGAIAIMQHAWPVLKMMDLTSWPGAIVDRQGAFVMTFWIVSAFANINASLFFSSLLLKDAIKKGTHFKYIMIFLPIIGILAYLPRSNTYIFELYEKLNFILGIFSMVALPLLLFIFGVRRKVYE